MSPSVATISHTLARDYNGNDSPANSIANEYKAASGTFILETSGRIAVIVPSLLSADFGSLATEAR